MGSLIIRPGTVDDVDAVQSIANEAKTLPFLGGFTMRGYIVDLYEKNNSETPLNVVAELDGEIVGFSDSKNKNICYTEFQLVAVQPELRRQKIGTALYTYHLFRSALMGKKFVKDQVMHFNTVMQDDYLPFLGFTQYANLRGKIRHFSDLNWWILYLTQNNLDRIWQGANSGPHSLELVGLDSTGVLNKLEEYYLESEKHCDTKDEKVSLEANRLFVEKILKGI